MEESWETYKSGETVGSVGWTICPCSGPFVLFVGRRFDDISLIADVFGPNPGVTALEGACFGSWTVHTYVDFQTPVMFT